MIAHILASGYERKYAVKVLRGRQRRRPTGLRRRRPVRYGPAFHKALKVAWEAAGHICAERLAPFLPDPVSLLQGHGHMEVDPATRSLLAQASTATIERHLRPLRRGLLTRRMSQTKPGTLLRKQIPVIVGK